MAKRVYYKKMRHQDYFRCMRDGSIRRKGKVYCHCPHFKPRLIDRLLDKMKG